MQAPDNFIQRRYKLNSLDVHPTEQAIVISYEVEAALLGQMGDTMLEETKECQKLVRVRGLTESSDVSSLAKEILDKCDLIPYSKLEEIELLLSYLKKRKDQCPKKTEEVVEVSINNLDEYIELLYEDIGEKICGSSYALRLARIPSNLEILANKETFLGALARVLREDGKKNLDLSLNIAHVFFCFSVYSQFHPLILQYKIGSICMDLIEYELNRQQQFNEDLTRKRTLTESERDNLSVQDYEKSLKKYEVFVKKQDRLLKVSFSLLLNIAEDAKVEVRMVSRGIVSLLVRTLDHQHPELLTLVVTFLKKLSIFVENKNEMAKLNVVDKLIFVLSNYEDPGLVDMTLRLLFNLSFDLDLRNMMLKQGLLTKLVDLLSLEEHHKVLLYLLNHISMDDKCKSMFTYTDCIPIVMRQILECPTERVPLELVSLGVNLAANKRNAQIMCQDNGLKMLMRRVFRFKDSLLMKMVRNISQHEGPTKELFLEHVSSLGGALKSCEESEEFVLECMGVLGNLNIPNLNFEKLFRRYGMAGWLKARLDSCCEDDLLLDMIVLLGTAMADEGAAALLLEEGVLVNIMDLLNAKQEDDEVVLQILFLFQQLLKHPKIRSKLIADTHVPAYLIDLMHDKNDEIRKVCDATLDIIAEDNKEWADKIQVEKFRWHNAHWLEVIQNQKGELQDTAFDPYGDDIFDQMKLIYSFGDQEDLLTEDEEESLGSPDSDSSKPSSQAGRPHSRYNNRSSNHFGN